MRGAERGRLPSPFPNIGIDDRSMPLHNVTPNTSIHPSMTPYSKPSVLIIASCNTLCIPKKRKTESASMMNWTLRGRESSLIVGMGMLLLKGAIIPLEFDVGFDGVDGCSSALVVFNMVERTVLCVFVAGGGLICHSFEN